MVCELDAICNLNARCLKILHTFHIHFGTISSTFWAINSSHDTGWHRSDYSLQGLLAQHIVFSLVLRLCQRTTYRKLPHILSDGERDGETGRSKEQKMKMRWESSYAVNLTYSNMRRSAHQRFMQVNRSKHIRQVTPKFIGDIFQIEFTHNSIRAKPI